MEKIKIDLDGKTLDNVERFIVRLKLLKKLWGLKGYKINKLDIFETKKGFHIIVYLETEKPLDFYEKLVYRLLLLDDNIRVIHDLINNEEGYKMFVDILFNNKSKYMVNDKVVEYYKTGERKSLLSKYFEELVNEVLEGDKECQK